MFVMMFIIRTTFHNGPSNNLPYDYNPTTARRKSNQRTRERSARTSNSKERLELPGAFFHSSSAKPKQSFGRGSGLLGSKAQMGSFLFPKIMRQRSDMVILGWVVDLIGNAVCNAC